MRVLINMLVAIATLTIMPFQAHAQIPEEAHTDTIQQTRLADFSDFKQRIHKIIGSLIAK